MSEVLNHLWQSTLFSAAAALASVALRRNSPRLRYWLWLTASVKFLVPFSLIVFLGARVQFPPDTPSLHAVTVQQISTYYAPVSVFPAVGSVHAASRWPPVVSALWLTGALFFVFRWLRQWRLVYQAARQAVPLQFRQPTPVLSTQAMREPGVFGLFRPVILLPEGLSDNLTPRQMEAILAHELRHVRYRDNITAALHMCVETLFWFHPAVWWIGARLMEERERDCDEAALRQGSQPAEYARGIVQVCETYVESPLACASGISGSDLEKRVREIMTWRGSHPMTVHGKAVLAAASLAVASVPFAIGVIRAQTLPPTPTYTYDAVSIHRSDPAARNVHIGPGPQGGLRTENTSVMVLLASAYRVQKYQIVGAPGWVSSDRFDVTFTPDKVEGSPDAGTSPKDIQAYLGRNQQRLQAVLRDRFGLVLRAETRELPIYGLSQAKRGSKLSPRTGGKPGFPSIQTNGAGQITASNATVEMLAEQLGMMLGRPVHDETALNSRYDFKLDWTPDPDLSPEPPSAERSNPAMGASIFTALTEQLGLRLESKKGPVQVYVIERIEKPTEN